MPILGPCELQQLRRQRSHQGCCANSLPLDAESVTAMHHAPEIRQARSSDATAIASIANANLGPSYFSLPPCGLTLVAVEDGSPIGFIYSHTIDPSEPLANCVRDAGLVASRSDPIMVLQTIVVASTHRHRGIGAALVRATLQGLESVSIVSPAWEHPDGRVPVHGLLEQFGFVPMHRFSDYWLQDSIDRNYACPDCGHPCHCAMILFCRPRA